MKEPKTTEGLKADIAKEINRMRKDAELFAKKLNEEAPDYKTAFISMHTYELARMWVQIIELISSIGLLAETINNMIEEETGN